MRGRGLRTRALRACRSGASRVLVFNVSEFDFFYVACFDVVLCAGADDMD